MDLPYPSFEHANVLERMIPVNAAVSLRVVSYEPVEPTGNLPIVLLGGLSTLLESMHHLLNGLSVHFPVHCIETREKATSRIEGEVSFRIEDMVHDVRKVLETLGLSDRAFDLLSYSLGGSISLSGHSLLKPRKIVLLEPSPIFSYPWWALRFIRSTLHLNLTRFRFVANWYMRNFVIDKEDDPEMVRISSQALNHADPWKLRHCILDIAGFEAWDFLPGIDSPVLLLAASKDRMHRPADIRRMVETLPDCRYVDLETNHRSHSLEAADFINAFLSEPLIDYPGGTLD